MKSSKKSIFKKIMFSVVIALLACIFVIEVSNLQVIKYKETRAKELYEHSLDYYSNYWSDFFQTINKSLIAIMSDEGGALFHTICDSEDVLSVEISKVRFQGEMERIAERNEKQLGLFLYVPERDIWIPSVQPWGYEVQQKMDREIKKYINETRISNDNQWEVFHMEHGSYFIQIYHMGDGYVGAVMKCEQILEGIWGEKETADSVEMRGKDGTVIARLGEDLSTGKTLQFEKALEYTDTRLAALMTDSKLYGSKSYMWILTACAVVLVIIIVGVNLEYQRKVVFTPLEMLRLAMEKFSGGDTKVRLPVYQGNREIAVLHQTFNHMADQITKLKIEVYETELERQKIQNNFLKIQIQPHFYTNILNLIYGLAQIKDYESIQKISRATAGYFRYLLGEKGTFVSLREEIICVKNYVEVQQFRYGECLEVDYLIQEMVEDELILPLVIQTFVGNSIKHNVTLVPVLKVVISIEIKEGKLKICVQDNGMGFDPEILGRINRGEKISHNGEHIGIANVKERIHSFYQKDADIRIESQPGDTMVTILLPEVI